MEASERIEPAAVEAVVETPEAADDVSNGVGQRLATETPEVPATTETRTVEDTTTPDIQVIRDTAFNDAETAERARVSEILAIGRKHNSVDDAENAVANGVSVADFGRAILDNLASKPATTADIGMSNKEIRKYSLVRALNDVANAGGSISGLTGLEREAHKACTEKYGVSRGFWVPEEVKRADFSTRALTTSPDTAGGHLVQEDVGSMIELLRNRPRVAQLGARQLSGLVGNLSLPTQTGAATAEWLAETGASTPSDQTFGEVTLSPKRLVGSTPYSKQVLAQASDDIEAIVRSDLAAVLGIAIDLGAIEGTGAGNQPTGIANTAGINTVTFAGAPTWDSVLGFEEAVAVDNADGSSMAFLTTPGVRRKWKSTSKDAGSGMFIWDENGVGGDRAEVSNQVTGDKVFYGDWTELLIGSWGGLDIVVDPYSLSLNGQIRIVITQLTDIAVRHAVSFVHSTDAGNQ